MTLEFNPSASLSVQVPSIKLFQTSLKLALSTQPALLNARKSKLCASTLQANADPAEEAAAVFKVTCEKDKDTVFFFPT